MARQLRVLGTGLPVRYIKVTNCNKCLTNYAYMSDVTTDGFVTSLFCNPLIDGGVEEICGNCRENYRKQMEGDWLLGNGFFDGLSKTIGLLTIEDAEKLKARYYDCNWLGGNDGFT